MTTRKSWMPCVHSATVTWSQMSCQHCLKSSRLSTRKEQTEGSTPSVSCLREILCSLSHAQPSCIDMVCRAFQLLLIMPSTNATSERLFSAICRVKNYLRSTMTQGRLNHLMALHYHQQLTDSVDLKKVANDFNQAQQCVFAVY